MLSKVEKINELALMDDQEMLFVGSDPKEFEDAIIGIANSFGASPVVAYDYEKMIEILVRQFEEEDDPWISAIEWFEFNIIGAYMGEGTPIYIERLT